VIFFDILPFSGKRQFRDLISGALLRIRFALIGGIRIHLITLTQIRILPVTLMRIRILLLIKVMLSATTGLQTLHGSILSFHRQQLLKFDFETDLDLAFDF
jgi:hypothetical protein